MNLKKISIKGLRGFGVEKTIEFAIPDGDHDGSGMTVFVGPNNGGKSTIIEAVDYFTKTNNIKGIPMEARYDGGRIDMTLEYGENKYEINSDLDGGSSIFFKRNGEDILSFSSDLADIFILSSERHIDDNLNVGNEVSRLGYGHNSTQKYRDRNHNRGDFGGRLRTAQRAKTVFNKYLSEVLNPLPTWYLETDNSYNQYLEFNNNGIKSRSSGSGDGIINIFNIIDSLYDSNVNTPILIDEPEKSLHPSLQRKLLKLLLKFSKDRQIIITTHSPYFVDWKSIVNNGMTIKRICNNNNSIEIHDISENTKDAMKPLLNDFHHPHAGGLNAVESFFLSDNVIVVEGQEDVVGYNNVFNNYGYETSGSFYGWGAGGYKNTGIILSLLNDLGYKKVFVILDGNVDDEIKKVIDKYQNYKYITIPTDDIRNKNEPNKQIKKVIKIIEQYDLTEKQKEDLKCKISNINNNTYLLENVNKGIVIEKYIPFVKEMIKTIKDYFEEKEEIIETSNEDVEVLNEKRVEDLTLREIHNNPISLELLRKHEYEDYGDTAGEYNCEKVGEDNYKITYNMKEGYGEKDIEYILIYNVNIKKSDVKLIKIKVLNNTFDDLNLDDKLIEK